MGFLSKLKLRDWRGVGNAPTRKAVLYTVDDVTGEATPITAGQLGGGENNSAATTVTNTYSPQSLNVGAAQVGLTVPAGANRAQVIVTAGRAKLGLNDAASAPVYGVGEGLGELRGAQLDGLKLVRDGDVDAGVRVDYWREV